MRIILTLNFIDLIIIILVVALCIRGYLKGFINELFSLGILILGLTGAFLFYRPLGAVFESRMNTDIALIISFFIILVAIAIILIIIRNTVTLMVDRINLTDIDYLLGVIVGFVKGMLLCGFIFIFLKNHPVFNVDVIISKSRLYPLIERLFLSIVSILPITVESFILRILGIK